MRRSGFDRAGGERRIGCYRQTACFQDISELCAIVHNSTILYQSASFEHERFVDWLRAELASIDAALDIDADGNSSGGAVSAATLDEAERAICTLLATAIGERRLVSFITIAQLDRLAEHLLELFLASTIDVDDYRRILELAVKLDAPTIVQRLDVKATVRREASDFAWARKNIAAHSLSVCNRNL